MNSLTQGEPLDWTSREALTLLNKDKVSCGGREALSLTTLEPTGGEPEIIPTSLIRSLVVGQVIRFKKKKMEAKIPSSLYLSTGGFSLYALSDHVLAPLTSGDVPTGLAVALPPLTVGRLERGRLEGFVPPTVGQGNGGGG